MYKPKPNKMEIEKGIVAPLHEELQKYKFKEAFETMEIGDSFAIPYVGSPSYLRSKVFSAFDYWRGKYKIINYKIISDSRVENGKKVIRFWRVK